MKLREIILDFTSLLDVFMLILFFFILFSHFEVEEAKNTADQAMQDAAALSESAEAMIEQAEEELSVLEEVSHGKAVDLTALMELSRGTLIQSKLIMEASGDFWTLEFRRKEEVSGQENQIAVLEQDAHQEISQKIIIILQKQGYEQEDKIPFLFFYDGTEIGSETAFNTIHEAFREVRRTYPHFYCIELDISDFGG